ncbi:M36 family metallopeptidase [Myxococcus sp. MISCRS1]|uniref:M36 family metallopeptidase n=1 Tax=Myxococcus sp. MISCRS1 TaxID=2996786 RepID=UPI002271F62D|nr:M36 family metallopeptidase [Myxococcus sp. MISCRS1]MCY0999505.1 M36 family metallopeptidase [Myxococcus sp. MISCRS1]
MSSRDVRQSLVCAVLVSGVLWLPSARAVTPRDPTERHHDARLSHNAGPRRRVSAVQGEAEARLRRAVPELRVEVDPSTGRVRSLVNLVGALSEPAPGDALAVGLAFVQRNLDVLGLELADVAGLEVADRVYSRPSGATHLYLRQRYNGVEVYNARLQLNVDREGRVLAVHSDLQPSVESTLVGATPRLGAAEAVRSAAKHLGVPLARAPRALEAEPGPARRTRVEVAGLSSEPIDASLAVLPLRRGESRWVWRFLVHTLDARHAYELTVDAETGEVWTRFDQVASDSYKVYPMPVEGPHHTAPLPPADGRATEASPHGWHDTDGVAGAEYTTPRGNNVHAYEDRDANNLPPTSGEPDCGVRLDCVFPLDLTGAPSTYVSASVVNLFYWNNRLHDVLYPYGFDEVAGNFQVNNLGRGGLGNDDVRAEAQDGGGINNANFLTPPDGVRPRMQLYLWTAPDPDRDGSLDSGIIAHEYGHGVSNRLVGGPSIVSCLTNRQQPGEGLSDFLALVFTARPGDTANTPRGVGTYLLNQAITGAGLRPQPYTLDPLRNTWTYESSNTLPVPHGVGAVFAQALWEVYWALVTQWGFDANLHDAQGRAGNQRMLLYFVEGLKRAPCNPSFLQTRDAIISAAHTLHGGEDVCRMWRAFAGFGLGSNATAFNAVAVNGYALPPSCDFVRGRDDAPSRTPR